MICTTTMSESRTAPVLARRCRWNAVITLCVPYLVVVATLTIAIITPALADSSKSSSDQGRAAKQTAQPPAPLPDVLRPYRVQVIVSIQDDTTLPAATQSHWARDIQSQLQSRFRQMWDVTVRLADSRQQLTDSHIASLTEESPWLTERKEVLDKLMLLSITVDGGRLMLVGREYDVTTRTLGEVHRQQILDRRQLPAEVATMLSAAFRPIVNVDIIEENKIECLMRAGELPPQDPALSQLRPGDYLVPYLRYLDRDQNVRMIQDIPWTFLQVEDLTRSRVRLSQISAFRAPIPASRRRVEVVALRVRPFLPSTEIFVYPRGRRGSPLAGVRCQVTDRLPTEEDPVTDRLRLSTDRLGIVTIPADRKRVLSYLQIYSGEALLARVPLIPGRVRHLELEVPDDSARLNVEGEVDLLAGELIDVVATREVLMARARGAANQSKWDDVDRFLKDLGQLPTQEQFLSQVETLQVQAVYAARQAKDRVAESRIKRLCAGIRESATQHLDPFRIVDFRQEMASLRPRE